MLESEVVAKECEDIKEELFSLLLPDGQMDYTKFYLTKVRTQTDSGYRIFGYMAVATKNKKIKEITENDMNTLITCSDIIVKKKDGSKDYFKPNIDVTLDIDNIIEYHECKLEWVASEENDK
jgi:hypothetical protein